MKRYEVFCKDPVRGEFWTVFVEAAEQTKLTEIFEYAKMRTFGMDTIGVKENPSFTNDISYPEHGTVNFGLNL